MTNPNAYTVWCKGGRIGTFRNRERAEAVLEAIAANPKQFLHIQEWEPGDHYIFVTFNDDDAEYAETNN